MRIAIFSETYTPDINGVVTHIRILKDGLERLGHDVLIVTADSKVERSIIDGDVLRCPAVNAKKLYNYNVSSPVSYRRIKFMREFNPDVIHIHNEFSIGISGVAIAAMLKIPYVYTLHTMYDDYLYYVTKKPFMPIVRNVSHTYLRLISNSASEIIGPSKKVSEYLKFCGVEKHVNVISNPVELEKFSPEMATDEFKKEFYEKYSVKEGTKLCCFCGRLGKEKSIDVLLEYWAQTVKKEDNLKLFIFGNGPDKDELIEMSRKLGIENDVVFTGAVEHNRLGAYLAACHLYITASLSEMHSIAMLEAMASGLPVLYIRDENNIDQIEEGVNGYIFDDADTMYEKVKYICNLSDEEYQAFRDRVRESVKKSGAEAMAANMLEIYQRAIQKKRNKNDK